MVPVDGVEFDAPAGVEQRGVVRVVVSVMDQPVEPALLVFQAAMFNACSGRAWVLSVAATFQPTIRRE